MHIPNACVVPNRIPIPDLSPQKFVKVRGYLNLPPPQTSSWLTNRQALPESTCSPELFIHVRTVQSLSQHIQRGVLEMMKDTAQPLPITHSQLLHTTCSQLPLHV